MNFRIIICVFIYFNFYYAFTQNECDCNFKQNINLVNERDSSAVFKFSNQLKGIKSDVCLFKALELELKLSLNQKKLEKVNETLKKLEDLLNKSNCKDELTYNIYLIKAYYYKALNNYEKLSDFAFKALKEAEKLKDDEKEISAIQEIVFLFTRMKENKKRWSYVKRAERIILNQSESINSVFNKRWLAFQYENEYTKTERKTLIDSALVLIDDSKKGAFKYELYNELALNYRGLEALSYHKGELKNALMYIDSAIFYGKKIKGTNFLSGFYLSKAWDHFDLKQYDEAIIWMDSSIFYDKANDVVGHMMLLSEAAQIYEGSGKLDKAYNSFKSYSKLKDSILSKERLEVVNEMEAKYQTELKDAEIKRLIILLVVSLLIIIIILFVTKMIQLKRTRLKNKELKQAFDKQLVLEKELSNVRDNIAQDFHDDLGNRLARMSLLSNLVNKEVSNKEDKLRSKVKQITDDANDLYAGTRDFIFSLKENSDYVEELATYLSDFGENYFSKTNIKFVLEKSIETNDRLPYYWSKQLIYIFKEAMTNALKYAECHQVILKFNYVNRELKISCIDYGIGIKEQDLNSSNGLFNMKVRAKKIGGNLVIESKENQGTIISFIGKTA